METLDKRTRGACWVEGNSARLQRGLYRNNFVTNVVEDPEEEERCISEEDFDPTNWNVYLLLLFQLCIHIILFCR